MDRKGAGHGRAWVLEDRQKASARPKEEQQHLRAVSLPPAPRRRPTCSSTTPHGTADRRLQPRSAFAVEHHAPFAGRAEEPFTLSMISQPEGASANLPVRHSYRTSRAQRRLTGHRGLTQGALLLAGEARDLRRGHSETRWRERHTRTTTLPNWAPESSRSNAWRPSSSDHTESTGGCRAPWRKRAVIASNSASLPIVEPIRVH